MQKFYKHLIKNFITNSIQSLIIQTIPITQYVLLNNTQQQLTIFIGSKFGLSHSVLAIIILFL